MTPQLESTIEDAYLIVSGCTIRHSLTVFMAEACLQASHLLKETCARQGGGP